MIEVKHFSESDLEFEQLTKIHNIVDHNFVIHFDDMKNRWEKRDKSLISNKLLLYKDNILIGYISYSQGREKNKKIVFFDVKLNPRYSNSMFYNILYKKMLIEIKKFDCEKILTTIYDHSNYDHCKKAILENGFKLVQVNREYCCDISNFTFEKYNYLFQKLELDGIKLYDSKNEMKNFPNHYIKLEELEWICEQDIPIPKGVSHTREPFEKFLEDQKDYEDNYYGTQIVAVKDQQYIGATDLYTFPKSEPHKAWTGTLGVLKKYRRRGIATALKVKAIDILSNKGITEIRTDNEENNPMYKINVSLGFLPEPFSYEYIKKI